MEPNRCSSPFLCDFCSVWKFNMAARLIWFLIEIVSSQKQHLWCDDNTSPDSLCSIVKLCSVVQSLWIFDPHKKWTCCKGQFMCSLGLCRAWTMFWLSCGKYEVMDRVKKYCLLTRTTPHKLLFIRGSFRLTFITSVPFLLWFTMYTLIFIVVVLLCYFPTPFIPRTL
jgi:hypothetical protein